MVPQRVNTYKGQGQAAPSSGTSTVIGLPAQAIEANDHDELEAVVELNDDAATGAKSVSFQLVGKDTADGSDLTSGQGWTAIGDPVVVALGSGAQVNAVASARFHTRDVGYIFGHIEATITHSDASGNTVTASGVLVGVSKRNDPLLAHA